MPRKTYSPEQKARLIEQAEALIASGMSRYAAGRELGIIPDTLASWGVETPNKGRPSKYKGKSIKRMSDQDKAIIEDMWANYVHTEVIAETVGRSEGVIRQYILRHCPPRNGSIIHALKRSPDHIKRVLFERGEEEFLRVLDKWEKATVRTKTQETQDHIRARMVGKTFEGMSRNDIMRKKRRMGMTLQAIGDEYGITRERVRQITERDSDPEPKPRLTERERHERKKRSVRKSYEKMRSDPERWAKRINRQKEWKQNNIEHYRKYQREYRRKKYHKDKIARHNEAYAKAWATFYGQE